MPIATPKRKGLTGQLNLAEGWTAEPLCENEFINRVPAHVDAFGRMGSGLIEHGVACR